MDQNSFPLEGTSFRNRKELSTTGKNSPPSERIIHYQKGLYAGEKSLTPLESNFRR
jgi:hypothetical protein